MISRLFGLLFLLFASINVQAAPISEWSYFVFINGFNNLDPFGEMNINSMEEVGSTDKVKVVVQHASIKSKSIKRYLITKDKNTRSISSPVLETLDADMGDYKTLVEFVAWGMKQFPAKKYAVVLWNHGSGVRMKSGLYPQDISFDDLSGNAITTKQMGLAMQDIAAIAGDKIELYNSDACLMGMVEIAAEIKDSAKYFVGSQDLEPGEGQNYRGFLSALVADPEMNGAELGKAIVHSYMDFYPATAQLTMSVLDLSKLDEVMLQAKYAVNKIKTIPDVSQFKSAVAKSQAFAYKDYVDFLSFLDNSPVQFDELKSSLNELIIESKQSGFPGAAGASVWLPNKSTYSAYKHKYEGLVWDRSTNWSSLIKLLAK